MRTRFVVLTVAAVVALQAAFAAAQGLTSRGSVVEAAPIYLLPDRDRAPLRTAPEGTLLDVLTREGDWIQVRFRDPEFGPRIGFIEARFLTLTASADPQPLDLSTAQASSSLQRATPVPAARPPLPRFAREGFWFNGGVGYGTVGCDNCFGQRAGGLSGGLTAGGTLSPRVLLGVGISGFTRNDGFGDRLTAGTLDARLRVYPSSTAGFFLTGGYALGHFTASGDTRLGHGAVLGAGWDVRVSRNVSLTPFYTGFAMRSSLFDANVGQIGLGITVH